MNIRNNTLVLMIVVGLALAGCVGLPGATANPLVDTHWTLVSLNGRPVGAEAAITLSFAQDALGGSDGCNNYSIPYTASGAQIDITQPGVTTLMACAEPVMQQAGAYMAALAASVSYKIEGQELALLDASGSELLRLAR